MKVVLLRVGVDAGSGGMEGPLFADCSFEFIPIPERRPVTADGEARTYGNTLGRRGRPLVEYFVASRRPRISAIPMPCDPEFETLTYGDPTPPKADLRHLQPGDFLVFYCGLQGWDFVEEAAECVKCLL